MELWQKQVIRSLFPYSSSRLKIERAFLVKHPHVPRELYKYRQFIPTHLDALDKNILRMSSPNRFNDPYDSAVFFDTDRFLVEDQSAAGFIASAKELRRALEAGDTSAPKRLVNPIRQGEWRRKITTDLVKNAEVAEAIEEIIKKQADDNVRTMSEGFRNGFSALSLSENCSSTLMWSHYSDSHRGFVIAYDFSTLGYDDLRRRLCFPVFYSRKLRDATRYLARTDMSDYNNLFGQYMCLIKRIDWAYEKEWRIIHAIGPSHANIEIQMPLPSAIFLGTQVEKANEDTMRTYCRKRGVPLKRMVQRSGKFDLEIEDLVV